MPDFENIVKSLGCCLLQSRGYKPPAPEAILSAVTT